MANRTIGKLLTATALCAPIAIMGSGMANAQDNACAELEQLLQQDLPEGMGQTEDELQQILDQNDAEQCRVVTLDLAERQGQADGSAEGEVSEDAELVETERTELEVQDRVAVEGEVFLEQAPPRVDIEEGSTEVMVQNPTPDVTVNEQAAEIVIRQAPATIRVDMPQPTITIEQAAPEVIVTMPPPGVDISNMRPQIEVRQAEPNVRVTQTNPTVDLQISQAEDPESSGGFEVRNQGSGETIVQGEEVEASDAEVNVTRGEPLVTFEESDETQANVQVSRAEPNVRYESAEPTVEFSSEGEPQVEFIQSGEPTVTFQEAANENEAEGDDEQMQAAQLSEEEQPEGTLAADVEEPAVEEEPLEAEIEEEVEPLPDAEIDTAETEAETGLQPVEEVEPETELETTSMAPDVEREGFALVQVNEVDVERLTGTTVYDVNDENVGDVGDLLMSADGQIDAAIIDVGGFLGLGEKQVRVPFSDLSMLRNAETDELRIYVASTEDELEQMQEYQE